MYVSYIHIHSPFSVSHFSSRRSCFGKAEEGRLLTDEWGGVMKDDDSDNQLGRELFKNSLVGKNNRTNYYDFQVVGLLVELE